jgi:hypothetical protein
MIVLVATMITFEDTVKSNQRAVYACQKID